MGTIIGSPPNAIAVDALNNHGIEFGFLEWTVIGFPVALILVFLFWLFLIQKYVPKISSIDLSFLNKPNTIEANSFFKLKKKLVLSILLLTLTLWLTSNLHKIPPSAISLLPITLLTMFRIVRGDDVRKLPWDTLMLVAGGLSLGLAIKETQLAQHYVALLSSHEFDFYLLAIVFSLLTVVCSNFMSNTATTTILIPIAIVLVSQDVEVLPIVIGLSASAALFLPVSTPPNAIAYSTGRLNLKDFRQGGIVAGIIGPIVIVGLVLLLNRLL